MASKIAVYTIGSWPGEIEKLEEKLTEAKVFGGKYSGEQRLVQHAERGTFTHLLVSDESALDKETLEKLKKLDIRIMSFKDVSRLL